MQYSEAKLGRTFMLRLEDGEVVHQVLENFAKEHHIQAAFLTVLGGADQGSVLVVGPREGRSRVIEPLEQRLTEVHEITGTGTLFPDDQGEPFLHMHIACGRKGSVITGCIRRGVKVWQVMEVVIQELIDCPGVRNLDSETGFKLLGF